MNQLARGLQITSYLRSGKRSAEDLSRHLDVCYRTVQRYLEAVEAAGLPLTCEQHPDVPQALVWWLTDGTVRVAKNEKVQMLPGKHLRDRAQERMAHVHSCNQIL